MTHDPTPDAFPIDESFLIVAGEVHSVNSFLSNDKGGVYTEFKIRVDEILKNIGKKNPKTVTADREGGVVVYPNGQRVLYQSSEKALPVSGSKYLFFLRRDDASPNYEIITSYNLSSPTIYQLENSRSSDAFRNEGKSTFLEIVRSKIARH